MKTIPAEVTLFPKRARQPGRFRHWLDSIRHTFREYLSRQGLNLTRQRETILKCLMSAERHLEMDELCDRVRRRDPSVGRATVFRTVRLLQECGLVAEVGSAQGRSKFELKADRPHHDHMICVECGRITEFQSPTMERLQGEASHRHGFQALWHRHEIFGRCASCSPRKVRGR